MDDETFPVVIQKGSVQVKIYRCMNKGRVDYFVSYYLGRMRKRTVFSDFEKAKKEARFVAGKLDKQEGLVLELSPNDRLDYKAARFYLDPLGVSVQSAAMEYAEAMKKLGTVHLHEAVDYFLEWAPGRLKMPVADVVEELLNSKDEALLTDSYIKSMRHALGQFTKRFKGNITDIRGPEINEWLRGLGVGACSQNNLRKAINSLFIYAMRRRYLPRDHDELCAVPAIKEPPTETEFFTPAELVEILCFTPERIKPFMVIGAFAGVRHAELQRLEWADLQLAKDYVVVRVTKSKTASRRIVPVHDNLRAWLDQMRPGDGEICELTNMASSIALVVRDINNSRRAAWAQTDESVTGAGRTVRILGARHERKCPLCDSRELLHGRHAQAAGLGVILLCLGRGEASRPLKTKRRPQTQCAFAPREERQRRVSNPLTFPRLAARLNHPPT